MALWSDDGGTIILKVNKVNARRKIFLFFLTGMMGAGKTTLLRRLEQNSSLGLGSQLGSKHFYYDLDQVLEQRVGQDLYDFIVSSSLDTFRELELQTLQDLMAAWKRNWEEDESTDDWVFMVALGGGTLNASTWEGFFSKLEQNGGGIYSRILWLKTDFEECYRRCAEDHHSRRPLMNQSKKQLAELYQKRTFWYQKAHIHLTSAEAEQISSIGSVLDLA